MSFDIDLIEQGLKPSPTTREAMKSIEDMAPGDYEIYAENLVLIVEEGKAVMTKMGISSMLHSGDSMAGIYTAAGDLVTSVCGTYLHTVTGQIPVKFIIKHFKDDPTVQINEGDVYYCNEAIYGGIHNPDQFAIMPIFSEGELIAWTVVGAHQSETGGKEPGGEITTAITRHDEGMKLTPIKIGEGYQLKADLLKMMENFMSRAPRMQVTDVKARVAACDRVRIRMQNLAKKKGNRFLATLFLRQIKESADGARKRIQEWNDGTYRHVVFIDTTGSETSLLRVPVALHKKGDRITIDLTGTSPEHEGSFQSLAPCVRAHCAHYLYEFPFHDFPISAGSMDPIDYIIPFGTIMDPDPEAAISCSPITASAAFPLLAVVFSKMMFDSPQRDLVCGFASSNSAAPMITCVNQHGAKIVDFMAFPLNAWGLAARYGEDGVDVFGFPHAPWGKGPDVEDVERAFPVLHLYQKSMPDSGGYGKHRGGIGLTVAYTVHQAPYAVFTATAKESKFPTTCGLFGGYSQTVVPAIRVVDTDVQALFKDGKTPLPDNDHDILERNPFGGEIIREHQTRPARIVKRGEVITSSTQGAGGYGDVLERPPEKVMEDLRAKALTHWAAENVYKVAYNRETLKVDIEGTGRLRKAERENRLARGKPCHEFVEEWSKKRPHPQALKFYGTWPDAQKNREVIRI
ncbi:MAG: hydantoinase B/oxoprolinase family protein [Nitrospinota bacterium]|jgi:acetophenone carboxylase|nr:hydantoinase B/oxoprolinase family protein [Nitrospinota bacterium]